MAGDDTWGGGDAPHPGSPHLGSPGLRVERKRTWVDGAALHVKVARRKSFVTTESIAAVAQAAEDQQVGCLACWMADTQHLLDRWSERLARLRGETLPSVPPAFVSGSIRVWLVVELKGLDPGLVPGKRRDGAFVEIVTNPEALLASGTDGQVAGNGSSKGKKKSKSKDKSKKSSRRPSIDPSLVSPSPLRHGSSDRQVAGLSPAISGGGSSCLPSTAAAAGQVFAQTELRTWDALAASGKFEVSLYIDLPLAETSMGKTLVSVCCGSEDKVLEPMMGGERVATGAVSVSNLLKTGALSIRLDVGGATRGRPFCFARLAVVQLGRVPSSKATVAQSYVFESEADEPVLVSETLLPSPFAFSVPKALLGVYAARHVDEARQLLALVETQLVGAVEAGPPRELDQADVNRVDNHVTYLESVLAPCLKVSNADTEVAFKPSTTKSDPALRFVATNMQVMEMMVKVRGSPLARFSMVTCGAPAAHVYGYGKNAGILELREKAAAEALNVSSDKAALKVEKMAWRARLRTEAAFAQAVSALVTVFAESVNAALRADVSPLGPDEATLLDIMAEHGYLVQFESLLSTSGKESVMLSDMAAVVERLATVSFRIVPVARPGAVVPGSAADVGSGVVGDDDDAESVRAEVAASLAACDLSIFATDPQVSHLATERKRTASDAMYGDDDSDDDADANLLSTLLASDSDDLAELSASDTPRSGSDECDGGDGPSILVAEASDGSASSDGDSSELPWHDELTLERRVELMATLASAFGSSSEAEDRASVVENEAYSLSASLEEYIEAMVHHSARAMVMNRLRSDKSAPADSSEHPASGQELGASSLRSRSPAMKSPRGLRRTPPPGSELLARGRGATESAEPVVVDVKSLRRRQRRQARVAAKAQAAYAPPAPLTQLPDQLFLDTTQTKIVDERDERFQAAPSTLAQAPDAMTDLVGLLPDSVQIEEDEASGGLVVSLLAVYDPQLVTLPARVMAGDVIRVVPVLFSQGINEMQTMSNLLGGAQQQQDINEHNLRKLQRYFRKTVLLQRGAFPNYDYGTPATKIYSLLATIHRTVKLGKSSKSSALLQRVADVVRMLGGGRVTSCKSAKDRTSMSSTLEHARILASQYGANEVRATAAVMRCYGVRRMNAELNAGKRAYAFNRFQALLLPSAYKPPKSATASKVQS
ncbi:uncharacterized protein AMSG_02539 [Thecamonas trahens ATCC 50062]|uniref:Uncharacterized protein n=1 Tax=Thecamonas trahens ATCC 50062 TaxID=461836 RepID=A0A0L0D5A0_THETB|nr:hypothetical protein AMSG_02539 [Thecamonas trahens ATCC 50062]KNC47519.1 hypothetical protein AMSG_02539 [Thecamonas trahens ATCC 50062]|eukprot:XP_013759453.1 hypothetical protein AMSG_02539 [Thecamonas trahens ATCC 50062]